MNPVSIQVQKVTQPIGEFYIGSIDSQILLDITSTDVRRFTQKGNPDDLDGIQRELSKQRIKELEEYVNLEYATFPTSVILAVDERCAKIVKVPKCEGIFDLQIHSYEGDLIQDSIPISKAAFVIDGQHRLAGLKKMNSTQTFQVNVSIFVGADKADQVEVFRRVNLAQTKVNKSLSYDLFEYDRVKSPIKVAHDLVIALNNDINGPFHHRIKRLGVCTPGLKNEMLAQATVVNGLLRHLPRRQDEERSNSLLGLSGRQQPNESWRQRIFVDFYREDDLVAIFLNVSNFFEAVRDKWPGAWNNPQEGQILARTTGFNALIRFLKDVFLEVSGPQPRKVGKSEYAEVFKLIGIDEVDLTKDNYVPGSSGQGLLYRDLGEGLKGWKLLGITPNLNPSA